MTTLGTRIGFDEAVLEALRMEMHRDPEVVVFTSRPDGVAARLRPLFGPERVIETHAVGAPVILAAAGAAETGLRPVCELSPAEAGPAALDQLTELAASHRADGELPLAVRLAWGDPLAGGGAAGSDPFGPLIGAAGLKVASPATPADAKGLTMAAVRDRHPVCVLEHASLSATTDTVPEGAHVVELGRARLASEGEAMTLVAHGTSVPPCERAARELELDADLLDLRTLQPLDTEAVLTSVRKTGRVLFVEPSAGGHRITAELVAAVWERAFEYLDAPPRRICVETPPMSQNGARTPPTAIEAIKGVTDELLAY